MRKKYVIFGVGIGIGISRGQERKNFVLSHATADANADAKANAVFLSDTDDSEKKTKMFNIKKKIVMDS